MLEMHPIETPVASTAHPQHPNRLRNRAFNTGSLLVSFLEFIGLLAHTSCLQGTELRFRDETNLSSVFRGCAALPHGTDPTGFGGKLRLNSGFATTAHSFIPFAAVLSLRAGDDTLLEIHLKAGEIESPLGVGLPTDIGTRRTEQINAILVLGLDEGCP